MYFRVVALLLTLMSVYVHSAVRIVDGSNISINKCSYQLSLQKNGKHICGAAVISKSWALTAARCIKGVAAKDLNLRAGSDSHNSGGILYAIKKIISHDSNKDDIGLLEVTRTFDSKIAKPVELVSQGSIIKPGEQCLITGWGVSTLGSSVLADKLQQVTLPLVDSRACQLSNPQVTSSMICAGYTTGGKDICDGDWGGPLVCGGRLAGIASQSSCGRTGSFGTYTSISALRSWIKNNSGI